MQRITKRLLALGALALFALPATAAAAPDFSQSQITSPGDPYVLLDKAGDSNTITVTGTTNAATPVSP